ncbi:MAG TPA: hypothetical protein PLD25_30480 [Chloroflexota bacterium]|nr:hypothetical protein [Chloroflexota bacterium]HUM68186.1 hypothetical protein [Chloroflexota bacterium]
MTMQFIRSTHEDGRFRHFSPEANRFWRRYATVVGAVLPLESPLSFAELMTACREYALEYAETSPLPELHESYVAWVLIHLIEYGMVTAVPPYPPTPLPTTAPSSVIYHINRPE